MNQELFEEILEHYAGQDHELDVKSGRDEYFAQLSDLREDDSSYERMTQCFLFWYVIDRPLSGRSSTPLQAFAAGRLPAEQQAGCASLAASVHSVFEVLRLEEGGTQLKNLFSLELLQVRERRQLAGLKRGDLIEARLVPVADRLVFATGAFVHHPREARPAILKAIDRSRREGKPKAADLIKRLQALTFRFSDRYQGRVPIEKVFSELD
jgi:hypothetical protein